MKRTAWALVVLLIVVAASPTVRAAADSPNYWTLSTDGAPIRCGMTANIFRDDLTSSGRDGWPVLINEEGSILPAEDLAATGNIIMYTQGDTTIQHTFVLMGDVMGSGLFNIPQLVTMARLVTSGDATPLQEAAGDLNGNGRLDVVDIVLLAGYVREGLEPGPEEPYPEPDSEAHALIVCYSATGTTRRVAEFMAQAVNGDLFELEPEDPYTAADLDWTNPESRVSREHNDPALRDIPLISDSVGNFEAYETIYIGYPIWWGIAAWPVNSFIRANDFEGKNVWCFCTSASSGVGDSARLLEQLAGSGTWLGAQRFSAQTTAADVEAWLTLVGEVK